MKLTIEESEYFTCPKCGGHCFGCVCKRGPDGIVDSTDVVKCHGKVLDEMEPWGVHKRILCDWLGSLLEQHMQNNSK